MDLVPVIRDLLLSHDCVILPGFGGFIGNYAPAHCDKSTNTFYPPARLISFNRNLNHNDGLLTGSISAKTGLAYSDARNLAGEFVDDIKRRLEKGEKVVFDQIGSFTTNSEGNYVFEPDRGLNFNLQSYGLTSFTFTPVAGINHLKKIKGADIEVKRTTRKLSRYLWRAAVIIPVAGALMAIPFATDIFNTRTETTSLYPVAVTTETGNLKAEPGYTAPASEAPANSEAAGEPVASGVPASSETLTSVTESYHVITGSFRLRENAEVLVRVLKDSGYEPMIVDGPEGFIRVSARRCNSIDEAVKVKNTLAARYPGAWIKKAI